MYIQYCAENDEIGSNASREQITFAFNQSTLLQTKREWETQTSRVNAPPPLVDFH